ncbi:MAG: hypothetical protein IJX89_02180 [Alphaproteobacteria bacterium]|nr:hypothetical protein [Alphaproteobacteria bacterium]
MKFKWTLPYIITGAGFILTPTTGTVGNNLNYNVDANKKIELRLDTFAKVDTFELYVTASREQGRDVLYTYNNGQVNKRSGGTRAWRNCNPGNLRYSDFSRDNGAIGRAGGFAVFPDEATGRNALGELLRSESYCNLSICAAIRKYAPPHENNTAGYNRHIRKMTGLNINTQISKLTDRELESVINAICIIEGWRTGAETIVTQADTNKNPARNMLFAQTRAHTR